MTESPQLENHIITEEEFFKGDLEIQFINKFSGKEFLIKSISEHLTLGPKDLDKIVEICNQKIFILAFSRKN